MGDQEDCRLDTEKLQKREKDGHPKVLIKSGYLIDCRGKVHTVIKNIFVVAYYSCRNCRAQDAVSDIFCFGQASILVTSEVSFSVLRQCHFFLCS